MNFSGCKDIFLAMPLLTASGHGQLTFYFLKKGLGRGTGGPVVAKWLPRRGQDKETLGRDLNNVYVMLVESQDNVILKHIIALGTPEKWLVLVNHASVTSWYMQTPHEYDDTTVEMSILPLGLKQTGTAALLSFLFHFLALLPWSQSWMNGRFMNEKKKKKTAAHVDNLVSFGS